MSDFSNYELESIRTSERGVAGLAGGLLPEMATVFGQPLSERPDEDELQRLIGTIGPAKTLQDNIAGVQEILGTDADAVTLAADWTERSGVLNPVRRGFVDTSPLPERLDAIVWGGGVANWIKRRVELTERFDPLSVGRVVLAAGNRQMGEAEHQLVTTYARQEGRIPTETDFIRKYMTGRLALAGFEVEVVAVDSQNAEEINDEVFAEKPELLDGSILVVGNAPNVVQAAGQIRLAGRRADAGFDADGRQFYMAGDTIPVARKGEGPATHQNPFTALGQIARNALVLERQ
jgi:hypothetical protein